jgi:hypothetical protein
LSLYDRKAQRNSFVRAYIATARQSFAPYSLPYRFNWDAPIAFDPFDPAMTYFGGNVVFASRNRGQTWKPISPDLTRNDKSHQQAAGGPLALDNTGAESTSTLLDIEPSTRAQGEMWAGSDDGYVQLTRDGGLHWKNVTPPGVPIDGRAEVVSPSPLVSGTAYTVIDRHYLGDHTPYVFITHDWGAHWTSIASGLPQEEARAIRADTRNPHLVYLGLENSFWLSYDDGAHWRKPGLGLPTTASYDIRIQPRWNDLIVATHGRGLYILDDLAPIQQLPQAEAAGAMLFPPRTTYLYVLHSNDEGLYTRYAGKNPSPGATIAFYQKTPGTSEPAIEILDATGKVVRHLRGTTRVGERELPIVTNFAGINRVTWDLREDGPVRWEGAAKDAFKGPRTGVLVVPGTYTVRITLAGRTYSQPLRVDADPRNTFTAAQYQASYAFTKAHVEEYSQLNAALNRLDAYAASAGNDAKGAAGDLVTSLAAVRAKALELRGRLTADFTNDEDFIAHPGQLREDMAGLTGFGFGGGGSTPNAAQRQYASRVDAEFAAVMRDVATFERNDVARANAALKAAGKAPLATTGAKRADVVGGEATGEEGDRD